MLRTPKWNEISILKTIKLDFLRFKKHFYLFSKITNANWTNGQNIENCATPPLRKSFWVSEQLGAMVAAFFITHQGHITELSGEDKLGSKSIFRKKTDLIEYLN